METLSTNSIENEPSEKMMTLNELRTFIDAVQERLKNVYLEHSEMMKRTKGKGYDRGNILEKQKRINQEALDTLLATKERFAHVFTTEKGSYYFMLPSGESFRIKKTYEVLSSQTIMKRLFFLETDAFEKQVQVGSTPMTALAGIPFKKSELKEGATPLEINCLNAPDEYIVEESDDTFVLRGADQERQALLPYTAGIHIGHIVATIIK